MAQKETKEVYTVTKRFNRPSISPSSGALAHVTSDNGEEITIQNSEFVTCRDRFHGNNNTRLGDVLMAHPPGTGKNILLFINAIERRMGHEILTQGGPTNLKNASWFAPADFWRRNAMRRSLFTILLRNGREYQPRNKNVEEALYSQFYTTSTRPAVERFLNGFTWYSGNISGWYQQFSAIVNQQNPNLERLLTKRPVNEAHLLTFALKKLGVSRTELINAFRKSKKESADETLKAESKEVPEKPKRSRAKKAAPKKAKPPKLPKAPVVAAASKTRRPPRTKGSKAYAA